MDGTLKTDTSFENSFSQLMNDLVIGDALSSASLAKSSSSGSQLNSDSSTGTFSPLSNCEFTSLFSPQQPAQGARSDAGSALSALSFEQDNSVIFSLHTPLSQPMGHLAAARSKTAVSADTQQLLSAIGEITQFLEKDVAQSNEALLAVERRSRGVQLELQTFLQECCHLLECRHDVLHKQLELVREAKQRELAARSERARWLQKECALLVRQVAAMNGCASRNFMELMNRVTLLRQQCIPLSATSAQVVLAPAQTGLAVPTAFHRAYTSLVAQLGQVHGSPAAANSAIELRADARPDQALIGQAFLFDIIVRDQLNNLHAIDATLPLVDTPSAPFQPQVLVYCLVGQQLAVSPAGAKLVVARNGRFTFSFVPTQMGIYLVSASILGLDVVGSPLKVTANGWRRELSEPATCGQYESTPVSVSANQISRLASPQQTVLASDNSAVRVAKVTIIGCEGALPGQLCRPWGVCCDRFGNIIVADRSNNRIQVFLSNGDFSHQFGSSGNRNGEFDRPAGVCCDQTHRIIVADKDNHRIQVFTFDGQFCFKFGEKGCRNGQFNYPWDVASDSLGRIAVSDTRNHRVQLFDAQGRYVAKFTSNSFASLLSCGVPSSNTDDKCQRQCQSRDNQIPNANSSLLWKSVSSSGGGASQSRLLDSPRSVCFDAEGRLYVSDFNLHRVLVLSGDLSEARLLGAEGSGVGQLLRPQGVAVDAAGLVYVADSRNNRVQVFEPRSGRVVRHYGPPLAAETLDRPQGICLLQQGRLVAVDLGGNRLLSF